MLFRSFGVQLLRPYKLYNHQIKAIEYAKDRENQDFHGIHGSILGLEMGLGKTLISLVVALSDWEKGTPATLVIVPKTLILNYVNDSLRFFGDQCSILAWDKSVLRSNFYRFSKETPSKNHIVVCSYDTVLTLHKSTTTQNRKLAKIFFDINWNRIICDESDRISNYKCKLVKAMMRLKGKRSEERRVGKEC